MPGFVKVKIPELFGDNELPNLVGPIYTGWTAGGWQCVPGTTLPDSDTNETVVRVIVVRLSPYIYRYIGTTQGWDVIENSPGTKCGARSPNGLHYIVMENDDGIQIVVSSLDGGDAKNFLSIGTDGTVTIGVNAGSIVHLADGTVSVQDSSGNTFILSEDNGIALSHSGGTELLSLSDGQAKLIGTDVLVAGGAVTIVGQGGIVLTNDLLGVASTEPLILGSTFLTALAAALTELVAAPTGLGMPTTNTMSMITDITTSLGAGAPYLSSVTETA